MMNKVKNSPVVRFGGFDKEWENDFLENLARFSKGQGYSKKDLTDSGFPIILYGRLYTKYETVIYKVDTYVKNVTARTYSVGKEVIVPSSGETPEDIAIASAVVTPKILIGGDLNIVYPNSSLDSIFLALTISNGKPQRDLSKRAQGKSVVHLRNSDLKEVEFFYPSLPEQQKIGTYFKQIDQLITLKQKKHTKLLNLKKAMLNKMFPQNGATTPEIRFKGFEGEWEKKCLGDIGSTFTGLSGKTKEDFGHGKGKFVTYMNVFSNSISKLDTTEPVEIDNSQNEVKYGDVFFTTSSETPEEVGMSSVWLGKSKYVYLNSFCFGYRPVITFDSFYLANLLRSDDIRKEIKFLGQGISRYNISKNKVMDICIPIASLAEQKYIGNYFKGLDNLISLQDNEVTKLQHIKKALLEKMFV